MNVDVPPSFYSIVRSKAYCSDWHNFERYLPSDDEYPFSESASLDGQPLSYRNIQNVLDHFARLSNAINGTYSGVRIEDDFRISGGCSITEIQDVIASRLSGRVRAMRIFGL